MKSTIDRLRRPRASTLSTTSLTFLMSSTNRTAWSTPLLATGRVAEHQLDRRSPGQHKVRVGGELAPGFLLLIVGQLAEDPDDPEVVGDDDRVNLRRFLPDRLPQGCDLLAGQAESVERPRELPGKLAEGRLLVPAAAGFRPIGQR